MAIILYEESFSQRLGYWWVGCNESEVGGGGRGAEGADVERRRRQERRREGMKGGKRIRDRENECVWQMDRDRRTKERMEKLG